MEEAVKDEAILRKYILSVEESDRLTNVGAIGPMYLELFVRLLESDWRSTVLADPIGIVGLRRHHLSHRARAP